MTTYLQSIQTGVLIFFSVLFVSLIPYMIVQYRRIGRVSPWLFIVNFSFVLYLIVAFGMTVFPLPSPQAVAQLTTPTKNLHLFLFVEEFIKYSGFVLTEPNTWKTALKSPQFIQPVFNLLLTLPFGFYLRYLFKRKFVFTLIASFLLTLFFELTQLSALYGLYPRPYRLFDVDDLLLNTLGALLGFGLAIWMSKLLPDLSAVRTEESKVQYGRRMVAFFVDFILATIVELLIPTPVFGIGYALFFLLIPLIFKGTLGQKMLRIRIEPAYRGRIFLQQVLSIINYLPLIALFIFLNRSGTVPEEQLGQNYLMILISLGMNLLPLVDAFIGRLSKTNRLWYERIVKTTMSPAPKKERKVLK
ncbi:MAG: VanZ family protein [Streptococcaceae bacterium]|nr:VanZ family protein [Streptococcaceae bacterium]MCL2681162.1 VanZ family protein [Streptococcaceae bacterium]MCL2858680.1 VanZ family protein [Streptococcaceae bacterium]